MWNWDQGRLEYFQFDNLRRLAKFAMTNNLKSSSHDVLQAAIGLPFAPVDIDYLPWRNYSRIFKLSMLVYDVNGIAIPTTVAALLASDGKITADEYFHFLAQATTSPSPALTKWNSNKEVRFPLLFSLKYVLAKAAIGYHTTSLNEIVSSYIESKFTGTEQQTAFLSILNKPVAQNSGHRQAIESIRVLSQISYLSCTQFDLSVSLDAEDALELFNELHPITGPRQEDGNQEIRRLSALYPAATASLDLSYSHTAINDTVDAGFPEGNRVEKAHLRIERNSKLRKAFFDTYASTACDFCGCDTKLAYPWTERVLDIHHLLPLCSGTRATGKGTILDDLVANCPTCHRAVHRYYGQWLAGSGAKDFSDAKEARAVYAEAKQKYTG